MTEGTEWPTVDPTPDVEGIDISKGPWPAAVHKKTGVQVHRNLNPHSVRRATHTLTTRLELDTPPVIRTPNR
jgi:hypothetical protein